MDLRRNRTRSRRGLLAADEVRRLRTVLMLVRLELRTHTLVRDRVVWARDHAIEQIAISPAILEEARVEVAYRQKEIEYLRGRVHNLQALLHLWEPRANRSAVDKVGDGLQTP